MNTAELQQIAKIVMQDVRDNLQSISSGFPPSLMAKMEKLLEHITICDHDYEYSCQHIPKWFTWIRPNATKEELKSAAILGWIFQFVTTFLLSFDDVCDLAEVRFGRPTWYAQHKNSSNLLFDIQLVYCWAYMLLRKHFRRHALYAQFLDFLSITMHDTLKGCRLELEFEGENIRKDNSFDENVNWKNWECIAREKPTAVQMYTQMAWVFTLAGYEEDDYKEVYDNAKEITCLHGILGQSMDDYWDCFSEIENLDEKYGDIRRGQLSWLLVKCKDLCSSEQWEEIKMHYGRDDDNSVKIVMEIYSAVGIQQVWKENKVKLHAEIHDKAEKLFKPDHAVLKRIVLDWVDWTYEVFRG